MFAFAPAVAYGSCPNHGRGVRDADVADNAHKETNQLLVARAVHRHPAMPKIFEAVCPLATAFDELVDAMIALGHDWTDEITRAGMERTSADARGHVCRALAFLAEVPVHPDHRRAHAAYERIGEALRTLAREAYLSLLTLGQLIQHAWLETMAPARSLERVTAAVDGMLDALAPFVTHVETGLRRCLLDDEPVEDVLASQAG